MYNMNSHTLSLLVDKQLTHTHKGINSTPVQSSIYKHYINLDVCHNPTHLNFNFILFLTFLYETRWTIFIKLKKY